MGIQPAARVGDESHRHGPKDLGVGRHESLWSRNRCDRGATALHVCNDGTRLPERPRAVATRHLAPVVPEALLSYFVRAPIDLTRVERTSDGKVPYKADRFHPKHHAKFRLFDPLEFLAHLAIHP